MAILCVCIPTWNGARLLPRVLNCLLGQMGADIRIIIGDDASIDATVEVARSFSDNRILVHAFPNHVGIPQNWNRTLELADSEYVALVGQDDEVTCEWARRLIDTLEAHPESDLAFGRRQICLDDCTNLSVSSFFKQEYPRILSSFYSRIGTVISSNTMIKEGYRYLFEINLIGEPSFAVFRRNAGIIGNGFDTNMVQMFDWEFFTRFFAEKPILHIPEILGSYHIHADSASLSSASRSTHYREYDYLLEIVIERFSEYLGWRRVARLQRRREEIRRFHES